MAKHGPDQGWRQHVIDNVLPRMEVNSGAAVTGVTQAGPSDFAPVVYHGSRSPDDVSAVLDGVPLVRATAIKQRALDFHSSIPSFEAIREVRLEKISHANRINELLKARGDGGPGLPEDAPQVATVRKQMLRAEQEVARLETLREIRTSRWNAAGSLARNVTDWLMHGGIPQDCVIEAIEDQPISELVQKGETVANAVERYRHRLRELDADARRLSANPWPSSEQKRKVAVVIEQLAEHGRPNFESMVEHNAAFGFPTIMLRSLVRGTETPALAFADDVPDVLAIMCWAFRDQLLATSNSELDEVADDKVAMDQKQRDIALAQISADRLAAERAECALIWAAEARGEVIDFRSATTPAAAIGVQLRTQPRADPPPSSPGHAYDILQPGGGRR
ncbi:hypothetical protein [Bradyrhizobium sp. RT10b]|uniref:hypothetical protein n=1 Tax=unclassified Bradyrhizobium TaxID=2631580 RepID=UPI00339AA5F0